MAPMVNWAGTTPLSWWVQRKSTEVGPLRPPVKTASVLAHTAEAAPRMKVNWGFRKMDENQYKRESFMNKKTYFFAARGKLLLKFRVTTFLPDWEPPLIFVRLISNFLCMCSNSDFDFEVNQTKIKGGCQSWRKVVPHKAKSDLPLANV